MLCVMALGLFIQAERQRLFAQDSLTGRAGAWVLTQPARRTPEAPPGPPPNVPAVAEGIKPVTVIAVVRRRSAQGRTDTLRQTITRTPNAIHIAAGNGREWWFERNPVDPRRVSASLVEHSAKVIVLYGESDLRILLGIRGWADVLALGVDIDALRSYERAGHARTVDGIRFARYAEPTRDAPLTDVWWSEAQFMASSFTLKDDQGSTRFTIERVRDRVDNALLGPPDRRYPQYRVADLANWLDDDH